MKTFLKILTLFIAAGAIGGAVMMRMDPSGVSWEGSRCWIWGFVALSNIFFVLGLIEAVCAVICLKK